MQDELQTAIDTFPVVRWLSKHTEVFDTGGGDNVYANCPWCFSEGHKKTLAVSTVHKIFRCFRCFEGGHHQSEWKGTCNLVKMIMLLEQIRFAQAKSLIFELSGLPEPIRRERQKAPQQLIPTEAVQISKCHPQAECIQELHKRRLDHLLDKIYFCPTGKYSYRFILPATWMGSLEGFEAKGISKSQEPKALYPEWFFTGEHLYSTKWDDKLDFAVITESIFDAETLGTNAIGLFGSYLKEGQLALLNELRHQGISRLVWMLDGDAIKKAIRQILGKTSGIFDNYIALLQKPEDPNSIGHNEAWQRVVDSRPVASVSDVLDLLLES